MTCYCFFDTKNATESINFITLIAIELNFITPISKNLNLLKAYENPFWQNCRTVSSHEAIIFSNLQENYLFTVLTH